MIIRLWLQDPCFVIARVSRFFFSFLLHRTIAIKFAFPARVSSIRRWITAHLEWTDTWETLMDWFLRDSWFRNYRVLLRFFEPLLSELNWNRSDFSVDFVDFLVWVLFFWGEVLCIVWTWKIGNSWSHWILHWNEEEELFWTFLCNEKEVLVFFFPSLFLFNSGTRYVGHN